jgi:exo-beta-1,3-glucanase (GH17 family)
VVPGPAPVGAAGFLEGRNLSKQRLAVLALLAALAVLANGYWLAMGRPVAIANADVARMACVSYAPYRKPGESPFDPHFKVTPERIDADLAALSRRFGCVRTYSVSGGLDAVPTLARKHAMSVLLGIWLSREARDNAQELSRGIDVANANRDVVTAVIVGNEVLLRGELPQEALAADIVRVKAATGLPVTYADVWEFWLKYPKIAPAVSFVTIHILPYWEDEPVAVADAVAHVGAIRERMQRAIPDRDILIGETGWPSEGRQRWGAIPSVVNQARFFREFLNWAEPAGVRYNLIEAFDQPWKRELEGTVGGYWGLYDRDLAEKFPLDGPVIEESGWAAGLWAGLVLAVLTTGVAAWRWRPGRVGLVSLALAGDAAGATFWAQWRHMGFANRTADEWLLTGALLALAMATTLLAIAVLARSMNRAGFIETPASLADFLAGRRDLVGWLGAARFCWLVGVAITNLLLVFDARYRDFPLLLFGAPLAAYVVLGIAAGSTLRGTGQRVAVEERLLAAWALVSGVLILILEQPSNGSADRWMVLCVLFAGVVLVSGGARRQIVLD